MLDELCFGCCAYLQSVMFERGSNLKNIEKGAFLHCGLNEIRIPANMEVIAEECFSQYETLQYVICYIESKSKLLCIEDRAFANSSLRNIEMPGTVEVIGDGCFANCPFLVSATFVRGSNLRIIGSNAFTGSPAAERLKLPQNVQVLSFSAKS